jgi:hypothetical protein
MPILRERQVWRAKPLKQGKRPGARIDRLTPEQEDNVRAWLRVLHARLGTWGRVADELHISIKTVERVLAGSRRPTAGWLPRVAGVAGASLDDVLAGSVPKAGSCPACWWCEEQDT